MELIMVNSVKLKIILTPEDMENMDITTESLDYSSMKTRKAFREILDRAKEETGFDIKHDKIYVQVFPSVDGGCEMFLTRKGKLLPEPEKDGGTYYRKKYKFSGECAREKNAYIAKSENVEDIINLCIRLKKNGFSGTSCLYEYDKNYYLVTDFSKKYPSFMPGFPDDEDMSRFSFMSDYADMFFAEALTLSFIKEHASVIAEKNAVEIFAANFDRT